MQNIIISKEEASRLNQTWYFTGIPCKNGHIDKRYVNTGICYGCKRAANKRDYKNHTDRVIITNSKSRNKIPKEIHNLRAKNWTIKNKEKSLEIKARYRNKNREKIQKQARIYMKNKRKDPYFRLYKNISKAIWENLKDINSSKKNKKFLSFVPWTMEELISHLEFQFTKGMNWDNYGRFWHLDHVIPTSWFDLNTQFDEVWELNNLQPMKAFENLSKNNRYSGKYKYEFES